MGTAGLGFDCHAFAEGRPLILGGVRIPYERGLQGHSDADVLTHAIIDALLGAAALGDIGEHFPDTDAAWKDADSLDLLRATVRLLWRNQRTVAHVDATVVMERPKVSPHKAAMRTNLARALSVHEDQVSVKATRGEGIGFVGREEGVAALAVATLEG